MKHSITRYRITLEAFGPANEDHRQFRWQLEDSITNAKLAFTAAHKKLASAAVKSILSAR